VLFQPLKVVVIREESIACFEAGSYLPYSTEVQKVFYAYKTEDALSERVEFHDQLLKSSI